MSNVDDAQLGSSKPATPQHVGEERAKAVEPPDDGARWREALRRVTSGGWAVSLGAVVLAVLAGSVMIAVTDEGVQAASGYFF